jgi:hypothetical protein
MSIADEKRLLIEAKIKLYNMLHRILPAEMTNNEINIAYLLSGDEDVQSVLKKALKERTG